MFGSGPDKDVAVVRRYIAALNARDPDTIDGLLAEDCCFVDSAGGSVEGRENAIRATRRFFELEPNFEIEGRDIVLRGGDVLVRGSASADDPRLAQDTLWCARVTRGKLAYWQSFGKGAMPLAQILLPGEARVSSPTPTSG